MVARYARQIAHKVCMDFDTQICQSTKRLEYFKNSKGGKHKMR